MGKFKINITLENATKIVSIILATLITIAAVDNLIDVPDNFEPWILSIHYIILAIVLVFAELNVGYVAKNFGLLKYVTGKGLYMIFLGTLLFDSEFSFQLLVAILCIISGFGFMVAALSTLEANESAPTSAPAPAAA